MTSGADKREAKLIPSPGDVIEIPSRVMFRVDKVTYSREVVEAESPVDGLSSYRLDGKRAKVTLHGEVVTP